MEPVPAGAGDSSKCVSTSTSRASSAEYPGMPNRAAAAADEIEDPCHRPSRRNARAGSMPRALVLAGRLAKLTWKLARTARSPA